MTTIADIIRRTGNAQSPTRYLVVVNGEGKQATRRVLSTAITKVKGPEQFRHGGAHIPVEQYAFRVDGTTYVRFADAASVVLKKHDVVLANPEAKDTQEYVKKAYRIINGQEQIRIMAEVPENFVPAAEMAA